MKINFKITLEDFIEVNPNNSVILNKNSLQIIKQLRKNKFLTYKKLAKLLGCSRKHVALILAQKRNPSITFAEKLATLFDLELLDLIEKIYPKFNPNGSYILSSSFPIYGNADIASLIGHSLGDGYVGQTFSYTNLRSELIEDVINNVQSLPINNLTMNRRYHKAHTVRFSTLVRDILLAFGAKKGNKVKQKTEVPKWIKEGTVDIKAKFVQALFDDEGTASYKKRELFFSLSKKLNLECELSSFLKDVAGILEGLSIQNPSMRVYYYGEGFEKRVTITLAIHGYANFLMFNNKINFLHESKRNNLKKLIQNTQHIRLANSKRDKQFLSILTKNSISALEISKITGMSHKGVLGYLVSMEKRNLIARTKRFYRSGAKWYIVSKKKR